MDYEKEYKSLVAKVKKAHLFAKTDSTKSVLEDILPELRESEDERIRNDIMEAVENWLSYERVEDIRAYLEKHKEQKSTEDVIKKITQNKETATKFLKSAGIMDENGELAEIYRSEQKPAEWSEEDEERIQSILFSIGYCKEEYPNKKDYSKDINWLKSLRTQPHWKPSEEQMNCLCAAVDAAIRKHNESVSGYEPARILKSLYEQLKKL